MVAWVATIATVSNGIIVVVVVRRVQNGDGVQGCNGILQATAALLVSINISIAGLSVDVWSFVDFVGSLRKGCLIECSGELHCFLVKEDASCPFGHLGWLGGREVRFGQSLMCS